MTVDDYISVERVRKRSEDRNASAGLAQCIARQRWRLGGCLPTECAASLRQGVFLGVAYILPLPRPLPF